MSAPPTIERQSAPWTYGVMDPARFSPLSNAEAAEEIARHVKAYELCAIGPAELLDCVHSVLARSRQHGQSAALDARAAQRIGDAGLLVSAEVGNGEGDQMKFSCTRVPRLENQSTVRDSPSASETLGAHPVSERNREESPQRRQTSNARPWDLRYTTG